MLRSSKLILAILLLSNVSAAAQTIGPINGGGSAFIPIPNFTANSGLPNWKTCRTKVKAGTGSCTILVAPGESTSVGEDAFFNGTASDAHAGAWPNQLAVLLGFPNVGINAETQSVMGDQSISPLSTYDTRVTLNGWSPLTSVFVLGGNGFVNSDATAFTFNPIDPSFPSAPTIQTDTLDVYWVGGPLDAASLTIDTGGAAVCTIPMNTAPSATALNHFSCKTTLAANTYNLKCLNSSGGDICIVATVHAFNSAQSRVSIFNGAAAGATITEFSASTGGGFDPIASIAVYSPALCIGGLLGNDAIAQTPIATFTADLTSFVNGCKTNGADVLLFTGLPFGGDTSPLTVEQYQAAVIAVATSTNVPVWDSLATFGSTSGASLVSSWQRPIPAGWNGGAIGGPNDITHWSVAGYLYFATIVSQILQQ